ncbi:right-handed parallel beta-helix repeat-containing protein [Paenibacillus hodogayensis]|uniref:Right-handed parallel beta-helix repeat-containing protein n=1 Tax=Paenibacillus hodogayensis TaxID=279208 RepID=A0ABV5VPM8_9BACL
MARRGRTPLLLLTIALLFSVCSGVREARATSTGTTTQLYVADFGAIGDGIHDDTDALNAAFQAVSGYEGIVEVHLHGGTYLVDQTKGLKIRANTYVVGSDGATIQANPSLFGWTLADIYGNNTTITGIRFDGNNAVNRVLAIQPGSSHTSILHSIVENASQPNDSNSPYYKQIVVGVMIYGNTEYITIDHSTIRNISALHGNGSAISRGVYVTVTYNSNEALGRYVAITNNHIHHISPADDADGIFYQIGDWLTTNNYDVHGLIYNNTFDNTAKRAVKLQANGITVDSNTIINSYRNNNYYLIANNGVLASDMYSGISVYGNNTTVTNNTIAGIGSYYAGIELSASGVIHNTTIANNSVSNDVYSNVNGTSGIRIGYVSNFTISSNKVNHFINSIWTWQNADSGLIADNQITAPHPNGNGIVVATYVSGMVQHDILVSGNRGTVGNLGINIQPSNYNIWTSNNSIVKVP